MAVFGVFGVTVNLCLALFGRAACGFAAANDAAVAVADARAEATEDFTVVITPTPDAEKP